MNRLKGTLVMTMAVMTVTKINMTEMAALRTHQLKGKIFQAVKTTTLLQKNV